ncbi:hypothetical protein SAMN04487770_12440 [Butyrivibrio sp. ob235]|uniref:hypothetical protein n=1 Tax=Butyrivibrio sp. ob235 TaxID=1761780 RepID=UPI0008B48AD7|nr:hypothetical protein [Butyrivibrio sp. ob235]SEM04623.1 hypothetical protein SAMN04487770_12440 [Butyrivibrio sp. ob235]
MSEQRFDPMTGQPINSVNSSSYKFDPMTGKPINQQPVTQQTTYAYDPVAIEREQSARNKKLALVVLGIGAVLFLVLIVFGAFSAVKYFSEKLPNQDAELIGQNTVEEPAEPDEPVVDEPFVEEPAEEPVDEEPIEEAAEEPAVEEAAEEPAVEPTEEATSEPAVTEENTLQANTPSGDRKSCDPYDISAFTVGRITYQLPEKVSDFLEDGWSFSSEQDASTTIPAGGLECMWLYYPGDEAHVMTSIRNFSLDVKEARDCYITEIDFNTPTVQTMGVPVTAHGKDISVGISTKGDVIKALGVPDRENDNAYYYYGENADEDESSYKYTTIMMDDDDIVEIISVRNELEPTDLEQTEVSTDAPDYLSYYVAPSSLGSDPLSGNFKLNGVVYNLPVPLQVLVDNGWKYDYDESYSIGAGQGGVIDMYKGDSRIYIVAYNSSDKACILKNTIVTSLTVYQSDYYPVDIEFPGGLNPDMTENEVKTFLNENNITNYDYTRNIAIYTIPFDQTGDDRSQSGNRYEINLGEDGVIYSIDITCYGWLAQ